MKLLKNIALSVFMTATLLAVSSSTFAAEDKRDKHLVVQEAAKNTEAAMLEAKSLLEKGGESEKILSALNEARQAQKEFRYEQTERSRQKLNEKLTQARKAFEANDNAKALADVKAGLEILANMKKVYDAAH